MNTDIIVLAAGKGTRMHSGLPKVLHPLAGRPMLDHVLRTARRLGPRRLQVVVGYGSDRVREFFAHESRELEWVEQGETLGTGHAVRRAVEGQVRKDGATLVLYGDVPLIGVATLQRLRGTAETASIAVLTQQVDDPAGLGRILRDSDGRVTGIVEEKDATEEQKMIREINTGILCIRNEHLARWLLALDNDNAQGEYYLTDLVGMAHADGLTVSAELVSDPLETKGINNRLHLSQAERAWQRRNAETLALSGVTVMDTERLDIRGDIQCGTDVSLDVNIVVEGTVSIGDRCIIGPNVFLKDCKIGNDSVIHANSHIEGARTGEGVTLGPFARLRAGTVVNDHCKIGNFVETKKAVIGKGSKVNHLSYIGDTVMGQEVNVGAGTITCNYDGVNKHPTTIGNRVFVGSNASLVAPVTIHDGATVGAGSTITSSVPEDQLGVGRGRQRNIAGWKRPDPVKKDNKH